MYKGWILAIFTVILVSCTWIENDPLEILQDKKQSNIDKYMTIPPGYHIKNNPIYHLPFLKKRPALDAVKAPQRINPPPKEEDR